MSPPSPAAAPGGHLFPGLAVGRELRRRGCAVTLLVSCKEIDRQAAAAAGGMDVVRLPAVGLARGNAPGFLWRFWQSCRMSRLYFRRRPPAAGAGHGRLHRRAARPGRQTPRARGPFCTKSNTIPGRANRWLAPRVDGAFVYFPAAREGLRARRIEVTGMPVREEFLRVTPAAAARTALGLKADAPVLLVMGGSQGARRINELIAGHFAAIASGRAAVAVRAFNRAGRSGKGPGRLRGAAVPGGGARFPGGNGAGAGGGRSGRQPRRGVVPGRICRLPASGAFDSLSHGGGQPSISQRPGLRAQRRGPRAAAGRAFAGVVDAGNRGAAGRRGPASGDAAGLARLAFSRSRRRTSPTGCSIGPRAPNRCRTLLSPARTRLNWGCSMSEIMAEEELIVRRTAGRIARGHRAGRRAAGQTDHAARGRPRRCLRGAVVGKGTGRVVQICGERGVPMMILGRGSNLLIRDGGIRGVVVCLAHPGFCGIEVFGRQLRCGAGAKLKDGVGPRPRGGIDGAGISGGHSRQRGRRVADERRGDGRRHF